MAVNVERLRLFLFVSFLLPHVIAFEQGPKFTMDFPLEFIFSNSTGGKLSCIANGEPQPNITWLLADSTPLIRVSKLRDIQLDGSLVFPPFAAEDYRQDVHGVSYRCAATNNLGTIVSNEIKIRGVVNQAFDVHVYDVYAIKGNTAVMRCHIPKFLLHYVNVTAWIKDSVVSIASSNLDSNSKYVLLPSGELIIKDVDSSDAQTTYRCQVTHRLTGETKISSNPGRLIVTESEGKVPPKVVFHQADVVVQKNMRVMLPCIGNGHPPPTYSWFLQTESGKLESITSSQNFKAKSGLLFIENVDKSNSGIYVCTATNELKSDKIITQLTVIESLKITINPAHATVDSNQAVTLRCKISGSPIETILWLKDGKKLPEVGLIHTSNDTLFISKMSLELSGIYQCFAQNQFYSSFASAVIKLGDTMPAIVEGFQTRVLNPGVNILINCIAKGNPIPELHWTLDTLELKNHGRFRINNRAIENNQVNSTLKISSTEVEDGGIYRCIAQTKKGTVSHAARINIFGKLGMRQGIKYQGTEGNKVQIDCPVYGYPINDIQWKKSERTLPMHVRHSVYANGTLKIDDIRRSSDNGMYLCSAIGNNEETVTGEVELIIMVPPKISPFTFQDELIREGARARIQCVVIEGQSPIKITWFKDDQIITQGHGVVLHKLDEFSSILMISTISPRHNGNYTCVASNQAGTTQHSTSLFVNVAPKITPFYFPDNVVEGKSFIRISCVVHQGDLPINFQWFKNGTLITSTENLSVRTIDDYSSILTIEHINKQHSGNYTCVASNSAATVSHSSQLLINVPPKVVPFTFQDHLISVGMLVRVSCIVSRGDLPLNISWLKDDHIITSESAVSIRTFDEYSSVLSIDPVKYEHTGNYTCVAQNHAGISTHSAKLTIQVPLRWVVEPKDVIIKAGEKLSLHCAAEGFPTPTIIWKKTSSRYDIHTQSELVKNNNNVVVFANGTMIFKSIQNLDGGLYICFASNDVQNTISHIVSVKVLAGPQFPKSNIEIRVQKGDGVEILCEATGNWPISYEWSVNNKEIDGSNTRYKINEKQNKTKLISSSVLRIDWVDRKDSTEFVCTARNDISDSKQIINLLVQENPDVPIIESPVKTLNQTVELVWKLPYDGNSNITQYIIQYKKHSERWSESVKTITSNGPKTNIKISNLSPATVYNFRVMAENHIGNGSFSHSVSAKTEETVPGGPPENVDVESLDANTLRITWKPPKKNLWNGSIRGYNIGYKIHDSLDAYTFTMLEVPDDYTEELIYQLTDLQMFTQYDVIVQAFNTKGVGPKSDIALAMTSEDVPSSAPEDIRCSSLSSKSIYVLWQSPPTDRINGILRGYKVIFKPVDEWYDALMQSKVSETSKITITNLDVNTNYSIQVLAYTKMGDGVKSFPIYCKTHEDVPEPPESIKVLPSSSDSVVVAWKPPHRSNGALTKYNIYYKPIEDGKQIDMQAQNTQELQRDANIHHSPSSTQFIELKGLKKNKKYAFWVTATSAIGESSGSTVVAQTVADSIVAAKSASFDNIIKSPWQEDIVLPCLAVGVPSPNRKWTFSGQLLKESNRVKITTDGSVVINKIANEDSGNYTCAVYNEHGRDEVSYMVAVLVPPSAPIVDIVSKTRSSIKLQWKAGITGGESMRGYLLHYKEDNGIWQTEELRSDHVLHTLENLACGTTYQLYIEAFNNIGTGAPSNTITVTTEGTEVNTPPKDQIIREGSTFVTVHLETWPSTGCPVKSFTAEYKSTTEREWTVAGTNIRPTQKKLVISGLKPATWYTLRLVVEGNNKPTVAEYKFATHTTTGATLAPDTFEESPSPVYIFHLDPIVFIPSVALLIVVIIASVVICFYFKRRSGSVGTPSDISDTTTNFGMNSWIRHSHTLSRGRMGHSGHPTLSRRSTDPSPYATSHLTDPFHPHHEKIRPGSSIPLFHDSFQQSACPRSNDNQLCETKFIFPLNPNFEQGARILSQSDGYDSLPIGS